MEDLLRFIPFILYGLYLLFGKRKEKKQTAQTTSQSVKRKTPTLAEILQDLRGEYQPELIEEETLIEQSNLEYKDKLEKEERQYNSAREIKIPDSKKAILMKAKKESEELQVDEEINTEEIDFDLRQAIIAQTILTRPTY
jgi:hypothetical protein